MAIDLVETLVCELPPPMRAAGFVMPFRIERFCRAFGENLGGNRPEPSWFEGHEVVVAIRHGSRGTTHMPVAALLRRVEDGALRLVASDQIRVRDGFGADLMLAASHRALALEALSDACDDDADRRVIEHARTVIEGSRPSFGEGPVDILGERREREDLVDARTAREIGPVVETLASILRRLSSPDRRAEALMALSGLAERVGVRMPAAD